MGDILVKNGDVYSPVLSLNLEVFFGDVGIQGYTNTFARLVYICMNTIFGPLDVHNKRT